MANEARKYELCYILKNDTSKEETEEIQQKVLSFVKDEGGEIDSIDEWPSRDLAYEIKDQKKGRFTFVQMHSPSSTLKHLDHYFSFNEDVLRHDVFRYDEQYDYHDLMKRMSTWDEAFHAKR